MARPLSPSMPTQTQIDAAVEAVRKYNPSAMIQSIGPNGVTFTYPGEATARDPFKGAPFSGGPT